MKLHRSRPALAALFLAVGLAACAPAAPAATGESAGPAGTAAPYLPLPQDDLQPAADAAALPGTDGALYLLSDYDGPLQWNTARQTVYTVVDAQGAVLLQGGDYWFPRDPGTNRVTAIVEKRALDSGKRATAESADAAEPDFYPPAVYAEDAIRQERVFAPDGALLADWAARAYRAGPAGTLLYTDSGWKEYDVVPQNPAVCGAIDLATGAERENDLALFEALDTKTAFYRTAAGACGLCDLDGGDRTPLPTGENYAGGFPDSNGVYMAGSGFGSEEEGITRTIRLVNRALDPLTEPEYGYYMPGADGTIRFGGYTDSEGHKPPDKVYDADGRLIYTAPAGGDVLYCSDNAIRLSHKGREQLITPSGESIAVFEGGVSQVNGSAGGNVLFLEMNSDDRTVKRLVRADGSEYPLCGETLDFSLQLLANGNLLATRVTGNTAAGNDDLYTKTVILLRPDGTVRELGDYWWAYALSDQAGTDPSAPGYLCCERNNGGRTASLCDIFTLDGEPMLSGLRNTALVDGHFVTCKGFARGVMDKNGRWLYRTAAFAGTDGG